MTCPVCSSSTAVCQEKAGNDQITLKCGKCGEITFSSAAYIKLASLGSFEKELIQEYCRTRYKSGEVIYDVTL
jgi:transcription elongation factor Elf1